MSDPMTPLIVFFAAGFLVWAIVMTVFWSREKNKKAATVAPGPSPSPCPPAGPAPAPDPKTEKGLNEAMLGNFTIFDTFKEHPHVNYTLSGCASLAKTRGADAFVYRNSTHAQSNTCIGIGYIPKGYTLVGDMKDQSTHVSGCVDPSMTWPACGIRTSNAWCYKTDLTAMPNESDGKTAYLFEVGGTVGRITLQDLKNVWKTTNAPNTSPPKTLFDAGYKYVAVTIQSRNDTNNGTLIPQTESDYYAYLAWGKTLPPSSMMYLDEGCSYGGTTTSSTKYKVGRKPNSFLWTSGRNPLDYHDQTTWRIYDLSQIV